jgi:hypothetical protein
MNPNVFLLFWNNGDDGDRNYEMVVSVHNTADTARNEAARLRANVVGQWSALSDNAPGREPRDYFTISEVPVGQTWDVSLARGGWPVHPADEVSVRRVGEHTTRQEAANRYRDALSEQHRKAATTFGT